MGGIGLLDVALAVHAEALRDLNRLDASYRTAHEASDLLKSVLDPQAPASIRAEARASAASSPRSGMRFPATMFTSIRRYQRYTHVDSLCYGKWRSLC
jgi:hypothetical protein